MSKDGIQTRDSRSVKADAITSTSIELGRHATWIQENKELLHGVKTFMDTPGFEPVARIITSMHWLNQMVARTIKYNQANGYTDDLSPMVPALDTLTDDVISVVADAGAYHWNPDHTISMIGSQLLNPAHKNEKTERTGAPFPWDEDDACKAAMAIPKATTMDYEMMASYVSLARSDTIIELRTSMGLNDVPAVFPIAISKGFDPSPLTAERLMAAPGKPVPESALVAMLLRLRGDWRQGIYDYAAKGGDFERLLGYLQVDPPTYGADWITAIISHINDHDLDKAKILHNPRIMETIITEHAESRRDCPWIISDTGMHARYYDVASICRRTESHEKTMTGLVVPSGQETNPAALETLFRILDAMDMGMEDRLVDDMQTADEYEANTLIVDAVHDMAEDMPVSYIAETLSTRMSISTASRNR